MLLACRVWRSTLTLICVRAHGSGFCIDACACAQNRELDHDERLCVFAAYIRACAHKPPIFHTLTVLGPARGDIKVPMSRCAMFDLSTIHHIATHTRACATYFPLLSRANPADVAVELHISFVRFAASHIIKLSHRNLSKILLQRSRTAHSSGDDLRDRPHVTASSSPIKRVCVCACCGARNPLGAARL